MKRLYFIPLILFFAGCASPSGTAQTAVSASSMAISPVAGTVFTGQTPLKGKVRVGTVSCQLGWMRCASYKSDFEAGLRESLRITHLLGDNNTGTYLVNADLDALTMVSEWNEWTGTVVVRYTLVDSRTNRAFYGEKISADRTMTAAKANNASTQLSSSLFRENLSRLVEQLYALDLKTEK